MENYITHEVIQKYLKGYTHPSVQRAVAFECIYFHELLDCVFIVLWCFRISAFLVTSQILQTISTHDTIAVGCTYTGLVAS
jgi:hypothetical protein